MQNCAKSVRIRSYSGPYSVWMQENTDQTNSEYGNVLRSVEPCQKSLMELFCKNILQLLAVDYWVNVEKHLTFNTSIFFQMWDFFQDFLVSKLIDFLTILFFGFIKIPCCSMIGLKFSN